MNINKKPLKITFNNILIEDLTGNIANELNLIISLNLLSKPQKFKQYIKNVIIATVNKEEIKRDEIDHAKLLNKKFLSLVEVEILIELKKTEVKQLITSKKLKCVVVRNDLKVYTNSLLDYLPQSEKLRLFNSIPNTALKMIELKNEEDQIKIAITFLYASEKQKVKFENDIQILNACSNYSDLDLDDFVSEWKSKYPNIKISKGTIVRYRGIKRQKGLWFLFNKNLRDKMMFESLL